ncbi:hypothetical protein [Bacillus chungangensis]|uniref:Uncharacterized protein n=1 Tax=Bacillus chungangensis TaxID=587633 RepID=A0ABT9WMA2_9BACI|nr:hypothetical protein [Bacillus chungangensis]MDQ0174357.1 hypothetical protein [Bacillus chungangensis]
MGVKKVTLVIRNGEAIDIRTSDLIKFEISVLKENHKLINDGKILIDEIERLCDEFRLEMKYNPSLERMLRDDIEKIILHRQKEKTIYCIDFRVQQQAGHDNVLWVSGWQ